MAKPIINFSNFLLIDKAFMINGLFIKAFTNKKSQNKTGLKLYKYTDKKN